MWRRVKGEVSVHNLVEVVYPSAAIHQPIKHDTLLLLSFDCMLH